MTLLSMIPVAERLECRQKERRGSWKMGHCQAKVRDRHCQAENTVKAAVGAVLWATLCAREGALLSGRELDTDATLLGASMVRIPGSV